MAQLPVTLLTVGPTHSQNSFRVPHSQFGWQVGASRVAICNRGPGQEIVLWKAQGTDRGFSLGKKSLTPVRIAHMASTGGSSLLHALTQRSATRPHSTAVASPTANANFSYLAIPSKIVLLFALVGLLVLLPNAG